MAKRYYIAYGSNLNNRQMRKRCPRAAAAGTAVLQGWGLLFKGSGSGAYLTIEKSRGGTVPVAVWTVTETDEDALDRYEGFPDFYYKKELQVRYRDVRSGRRRTVTAFVYIMREDRPFGIPSRSYLETCREGYRDFGFDTAFLAEALQSSLEGGCGEG